MSLISCKLVCSQHLRGSKIAFPKASRGGNSLQVYGVGAAEGVAAFLDDDDVVVQPGAGFDVIRELARWKCGSRSILLGERPASLPAVLLLRRGWRWWLWLCRIRRFLRHTLSHRYFRRALGRLPTSTWREIRFFGHGLYSVGTSEVSISKNSTISTFSPGTRMTETPVIGVRSSSTNHSASAILKWP